jgi:6-phospho-3-hexuloisomerase
MTLTAEAVPAVSEAEASRRIQANLSLVGSEIAESAAEIRPEQLSLLAAELRSARRVFVAGAGRSGLVLRMAAMRLMHLGLEVHIAGDTTTPAIREGDLLLVASGSGTTSGVVRAAQTAAKAGARLAVYTANPESPLAELADVVVTISAAQKTDHGSKLSAQYSGSLFEQVLFLASEAVFQTLWDHDATPAEELWLRHANLE